MKKRIVVMLLAGGQGSRLGVLTSNMAKPAVPFGGKYRIIDFPLSNCVNSGFDTVGVLTQYRPLALNSYLGTGQHWDLDRNYGGVFVLPPYVTEGENGHWYSGTANAIWQNREFVDQYDPDYVLILSGDHIYKMDYAKMLKFHRDKKAAATIAVLQVPWEEAHRFGIMNADVNGFIQSFEEKPKEPKSNLASMGIYIFDWKKLRAYMEADDAEKDFSGVIASAPLHAYSGQCTYCGHCRPCPANIDIAMVNKFYDLAVQQPAVPESVREHYLALEQTASRCIGCRGCEARCPFGVQIAERMQKAAALFGR